MRSQLAGNSRGGRRRRGVAALAVVLAVATLPHSVAMAQGTETTSTCSGTAAVSMSTTDTGLIADCDALLAAKAKLDPNGRLNWATTTAVSNWAGVELYGTPPRVASVDLRLDSLWITPPSTPIVPVALGGTVPAEFAGVTALDRLVLAGNQLTGTIPTELSGLTGLVILLLDINNLTGTIPTQLGNLTNLEVLGLSRNQLTGTIPTQLGSLTKLRALDLRVNRLTGSIPTQLTQLTNLERLFLSENMLTGTIPAGLGSFSESDVFELFKNELSGSVPSQFGNLTKLKHLRLSNNRLSGEIPATLTSLDLESLWLADNNFTCVPAGLEADQTDGYSYPECSAMQTMTQQSPGGPADGAECANTVAVALHDAGAALIRDCNALLAAKAELDPNGRLNWSIGVPMFDWDGITLTESRAPAVKAVDLASRSLRGSIPAELGELSKLRTLKLGGNRLRGSIPAELGELSRLRTLKLGNNRLRGSIPAELGELSKLRTLRLGGNRLTGCIPAALHNVHSNDLARLELPDCVSEAG